jgi:hypothetical protein
MRPEQDAQDGRTVRRVRHAADLLVIPNAMNTVKSSRLVLRGSCSSTAQLRWPGVRRRAATQ